VNVDKTGRNRMPARVDFSRPVASDRSDRCNPIAFDRQIRAKATVGAAVEDRAAPNH
jgi:hypothetical protein